MDTHASDRTLRRHVETSIKFLNHPNGSDGTQQTKMRRAAAHGGLISDTDEVVAVPLEFISTEAPRDLAEVSEVSAEQSTETTLSVTDAIQCFGEGGGPNANCDTLVERTTFALDDEELRLCLVSTQQSNLELCIKCVIEILVDRAHRQVLPLPTDHETYQRDLAKWFPHLNVR
ncbi:uncharacterized protein EDB91DRAFT_1336895 [Suillus paluster]|uniref:uncharacterized protein n=1 Tax=Suillus paluster TaxID=48578 RepID=UPI001B874A6F|nr:uncharacterized protein EDB91DRAFT_1336895 [Suillus paluster]KAG1739212.1 hypothetical protein EDB91DRAFT_1336895 [Suillus paluster]